MVAPTRGASPIRRSPVANPAQSVSHTRALARYARSGEEAGRALLREARAARGCRAGPPSAEGVVSSPGAAAARVRSQPQRGPRRGRAGGPSRGVLPAGAAARRPRRSRPPSLRLHARRHGRATRRHAALRDRPRRGAHRPHGSRRRAPAHRRRGRGPHRAARPGRGECCPGGGARARRSHRTRARAAGLLLRKTLDGRRASRRSSVAAGPRSCNVESTPASWLPTAGRGNCTRRQVG